jgi:putative membrane protein
MFRSHQFRSWSATVAIFTVAALACGKGNQYANAGASGQAGASATDSSAGSRMADTSRSTAAGGEVAPSSEISQMSDSNIVAKLDASDKAEVELARLISTKATNDSVKAYAKKLVTDHTKSEKDVMSLERRAKLAEVPIKGDTTKDATLHTLQRFRTMPKGKSFDSAFVQHEVEDHEHDIADAKAMQNQAKNPELKQLIQQTLPTLEEHLTIARRLNQQLENGSR